MHLKCHALSLLSTLVNQACWTNRAHINTQIKYHHSGIPIFLWYLTRVLNLMDSLTCLPITQNKKKKTLFPRLRYCLRVFDFRREISTIAEIFDQGTGSVNFTRISLYSPIFLYHTHAQQNVVYLDGIIKNKIKCEILLGHFIVIGRHWTTWMLSLYNKSLYAIFNHLSVICCQEYIYISIIEDIIMK